MLVEYMAESVLLLKEVMCWDNMKDIVYLKANSRKENEENTSGTIFEAKNMIFSDTHKLESLNNYTENRENSETSNSESNIIKNWNRADTLLYQHFNKTFWKKVENYGFDRMEQDKVKLSEVIEFTISDCFNGTTHD